MLNVNVKYNMCNISVSEITGKLKIIQDWFIRQALSILKMGLA